MVDQSTSTVRFRLLGLHCYKIRCASSLATAFPCQRSGVSYIQHQSSGFPSFQSWRPFCKNGTRDPGPGTAVMRKKNGHRRVQALGVHE